MIAILSRTREDLDKDREKWLANLPSEQQTALKQDKDWAEKTADYWTDRLVKANPKEPQVYVFRGYRQGRKGLFDNAIQDAEAALKLKPDDPEALNLAAMSCLPAKQLDKCAGVCHAQASRQLPKILRMYEILADVDRPGKQPEECAQVAANGSGRGWAAKDSGGSWGFCRLPKANSTKPRQTAQGLRTKSSPRLQSESATGG